MRIAVFHELHNGGARRAVNEIAKRLKKNNKVDLYFVDEKEIKEEKSNYSEVFLYKFGQKKESSKNHSTRIKKDTVDLVSLYNLHKKIAKKINKEKYDVVFVHPSQYTQAPFILRFINKPTVYYCEEVLRLAYDSNLAISSDLNPINKAYEKSNRFIRKQIDLKNIKSATKILANSRSTQASIRSSYGINSEVSYLGVDSNFFKPQKVSKDIDVLFIGSKQDIDGYDLLEESLKLLDKKIKVKVHVMGQDWVTDTELRNLYSRSKIVLCLARNEPFGLVPLEAASCEVPVVALNDGGHKETIVDNKTGFLVDNAKEIVKRVNYLLSHNKERSVMGKVARENILSKWTWDKSANKIEKNLLSVVSVRTEKRIKIWKNVLIYFLIFIFSMYLRLETLNEMGRTWDEHEYVEQGYKMIELIKKRDLSNSYFYTTYDHPPLVKYLYGLSARLDATQSLVNNEVLLNYDLTFSRILSSIIFSLGVLFVVFIGWKVFSPYVGVLSGLILSMLPFTIGLSQLVTTESFKIFIYPLAIIFYLSLIKKNSVKNILIAGIVTGVALQIKQSDILLVLILGFSYILEYMSEGFKKAFIRSRLISLLSVIVISVIVFFLIWPQAIFHLKEIQVINKALWTIHFSSNPLLFTLAPPEVFFGRIMLVPIFYYPVYLLITIPALVLLFLFLGIRKILIDRNLNKFVILLWFIVPFIMSLYSWRQHGLRYIIEIYPAISIIAAVGYEMVISKFVKNRKHQYLFIFPLVVYLLFALLTVRPYYLDYFNEFVGGTNKVYQNNWFQTGWWGQGEREAGIYVENNAKSGDTVGLALSPSHVLPQYKNLHYVDWNPSKKYDFVVVNNYHIIRDNFDDSQIRKDYALVHEVKVGTSTLVYVYKKK